MSHPFHKKSNVAEITGLPGKVADTLYDKLSKRAHAVWDIVAEGNSIVGKRKKEDDEKPRHNEEVPEIGEGDMIIMLMAGRHIEARVLSKWDDGTYSVTSDDGYFNDVPNDAIISKIAQVDNQVPSQQRPTREDIPAQPNLGPQQPQEQPSETANNIQSLLSSRGGYCALQIDPQIVIELTQSQDGSVYARLYQLTMNVADESNYQTVEQMVQDMGLNGRYDEAPGFRRQ